MSLTDFKPGDRIDLEIEGNGPEVLAQSKEYSIVSWNLGYFGLGEGVDFFYDGGKMVRPKREVYNQYLREGVEYMPALEQADFIILQEVDRRAKRSYNQDQYQWIKEMLPGHTASFGINYNVWFVPVPLLRPMGNVLGGIASLSHYRPVECYRGSLPGHYSWPVRMFMLDRCFIFSRFSLDSGKELVVINTHNEAFDAGEMRNQQMEHLRTLMIAEYEKGNYVVAGGDWNMNPLGYVEQEFSTGDIAKTIEPRFEAGFFPEGWNWSFDPLTPTNRSVDEKYARGRTTTTVIDFFISSPNIEIREVKTTDLQFRWSDHQPVMMRFLCR